MDLQPGSRHVLALFTARRVDSAAAPAFSMSTNLRTLTSAVPPGRACPKAQKAPLTFAGTDAG